MQKANAASVPRSERVLGRADCPSGLAVGDVVRITVAKIGNRYQVALADPASISGVPGVAVVVKSLGATDCIIQFHGPIKGVYSGLSPQEEYLLGTDGKLAKPGDANYPTTGGTTFFQRIGVATSSDELFLQPMDVFLGGPGGGSRYFEQVPIGAINGVNAVFSTAQVFVASGPRRQVLTYNGVRLNEGVGCDYEASESVPSAGFDTLTLAFPPKVGDVLKLDFDPDV